MNAVAALRVLKLGVYAWVWYDRVNRELRDCILIPNTQIVAGFDPVMPSFQGRISEDDLFAIITYIKSIGSSSPEANIPNR